ncbi:MAG: hypothetical protein KDD11_18560, partial [Acidobacteria bacterium]|nr:hypothetical protein [Acidobacteriota bacterium]
MTETPAPTAGSTERDTRSARWARLRHLGVMLGLGGWLLGGLSSCAEPAAGSDVPPGDGRAELAAVLGPDLGSLPFRLSGPLDRSPCIALRNDGTPWLDPADAESSTTCTGLTLSDPEQRSAFRRLGGLINARVEPFPGAESLHAWALSKILAGGKIADSLALLADAAELSPDDAEVRNDLGAARALQALEHESPRELAAAYEDFDQALQLTGPATAVADVARANQLLVLAMLHAGDLDPEAARTGSGSVTRQELWGEATTGGIASPNALRQRFDALLEAWVHALEGGDDESTRDTRQRAAATA